MPKPNERPERTAEQNLDETQVLAYLRAHPEFLGAHADLLVVDGNPLKDLGLFQDGGPNLPAIMKAGQFHKNTL